MDAYYTYLYIDPKTDTPIYVGKGIRCRAFTHVKFDSRIGRTIRKRAEEGYDMQPIITHHSSEKVALAMEIFWIAVYGRENTGKGTLFNLTDGGDGVSGHIFTLESRMNMSNSLKNPSQETRTKMALAQKGKIHSFEHRTKISLSSKGKKKSNETRAKMANSKSKPCTIDDITIYPSYSALRQALGQDKNGTNHPNFRYIKSEEKL